MATKAQMKFTYEEQVVQPDILSTARKNGAPDLVVETTSTATAERDRVFTRKLYAKYGVQEHWIVPPQGKTKEVLTRSEEGYRQAGLSPEAEVLQSPLLPGLRIPLSEIF